MLYDFQRVIGLGLRVFKSSSHMCFRTFMQFILMGFNYGSLGHCVGASGFRSCSHVLYDFQCMNIVSGLIIGTLGHWAGASGFQVL